MQKRHNANNGDLNKEIIGLQQEMDKDLEEENLKWKQRAKRRWLREGDRNTKFYHICAHQMRNANTIKRIVDEEGFEVTTQGEINFQFQRFYKDLFTTSQ